PASPLDEVAPFAQGTATADLTAGDAGATACGRRSDGSARVADHRDWPGPLCTCPRPHTRWLLPTPSGPMKGANSPGWARPLHSETSRCSMMAPALRFRRAEPHEGATSSRTQDRKSTRLNSSHVAISYAVFCLKKKKK